MQSKKQKLPPSSNGGDVNIEGHEHNRNHWKFGIAESLIVERDEVTRAAKVRTGKSTLEIAIQQLYPLELRCDAKLEDQRYYKAKENKQNECICAIVNKNPI